MGRDLRVLMLEDVAAEAELIMRQLRNAGMTCAWHRVETELDFRRALKDFAPSVILSDFALPGFNGLAALEIAAAEAADIPFIFVSGTIGEERAIDALKRGAVDYVLKSNLTRLPSAVIRAREEAEAHEARRRAEERVRRLTRVLQMLSGINTAVVRIRDRDALLNEACRIAHRVGNYAIAFVVITDPAARLARPIATAGLEIPGVEELCFRISEAEGGDTSLVSRVLRTGEAIVCDDIERYPRPIANREALIAAGIRSLAAIPLSVDETPVGAFVVGSLEFCAVGDQELRLLQEVAANLSFALQYLHKENTVQYLAFFDPLTGLARRTLFCERLARLLTMPGAERREPIVAVIDVERLAAINDSFGRHTGDRVLQCIAERLKSEFDDKDHLAHLGGGTFAAVILRNDGQNATLSLLYRRIRTIFDRPIAIGERDIPVLVKCGFAQVPAIGCNAETLLENAEAALHKARASGATYLHHRRAMNSEATERLALEHRLRQALDKNQFELYYQPKVHPATGRILGVEALIRWHDPERGLVLPNVFLPALESTGLIVPVGEWVLGRAVSDAKRWRQLGLAPVRVAANVSPLQLGSRSSASARRRLREEYGVCATNGIDIEITESALIEDGEFILRTLRSMRAEGVRIAIDDFGTGHSSLSRLAQLPVDVLKIDASFTKRLTTDRTSPVVVSTIIALARAFDLGTVAEGVETPEQLEILTALGCGESQGYLHSPPVSVDKLEQLLARDPACLPASRPRPTPLERQARR